MSEETEESSENDCRPVVRDGVGGEISKRAKNGEEVDRSLTDDDDEGLSIVENRLKKTTPAQCSRNAFAFAFTFALDPLSNRETPFAI